MTSSGGTGIQCSTKYRKYFDSVSMEMRENAEFCGSTTSMLEMYMIDRLIAVARLRAVLSVIATSR